MKALCVIAIHNLLSKFFGACGQAMMPPPSTILVAFRIGYEAILREAQPGARQRTIVSPVSYTHLTLPTN